MANFWNKRINKNNKEQIALDLNTTTEKVEELKQGERQIQGNTLDNVLKSIEDNKTKLKIEEFEIFKWYQENDLVQLRKDFGYKQQRELARTLKMGNDYLCRLEKKRYDHYVPPMRKLMEFYSNEFNILTEKQRNFTDNRSKANYKECKEAISFFKNFDLRAYMYENNLGKQDLIKKTGLYPRGLSGSQTSTIQMIINKDFKNPRINAQILTNVYKYLSGNMETKLVEPENSKFENKLDKLERIIESTESLKNELNELKSKNARLETELQEYKKLVERYEKLLDRI